MKRRTIKAVLVGISAIFILAVLSRPQHLVAVDVGKQQVTISAQYACAGTFPGSQLFYAEK
ncbi:MAG: hypothetical protein WCK75_07360 [Elusimicrobiota bacterium]